MTSLIGNATADSARLVSPASIDLDRLGDELAQAMTLAEAAKVVRSTPATLHRWTTAGVPGADGRVHKLAALRIGRRKLVRRSDLEAFLVALNS